MNQMVQFEKWEEKKTLRYNSTNYHMVNAQTFLHKHATAIEFIAEPKHTMLRTFWFWILFWKALLHRSPTEYVIGILNSVVLLKPFSILCHKLFTHIACNVRSIIFSKCLNSEKEMDRKCDTHLKIAVQNLAFIYETRTFGCTKSRYSGCFERYPDGGPKSTQIFLDLQVSSLPLVEFGGLILQNGAAKLQNPLTNLMNV